MQRTLDGSLTDLWKPNFFNEEIILYACCDQQYYLYKLSSLKFSQITLILSPMQENAAYCFWDSTGLFGKPESWKFPDDA